MMAQDYALQSAAIVVHAPDGMFPLMKRFLDNRQQDIYELQSALTHADFDTIRQMGHNLKGSGASFGFQPITSIGITIEQAAKEQEISTIMECIEQLRAYLDHVQVAG